MRNLVQFFKALSDETRIQIVALLLWEAELCVCDIEHVLELSQSKASRHLRYLLNSGILIDERKGVWVYYSLNQENGKIEKSLLGAFSKNLTDEMWQVLKNKLEIRIKLKEGRNKCATEGGKHGKEK